MPIRPSLSLRFARAAMAIAAAAVLMPAAAVAADRGGDVYVMTNQISANSVIVYHRATDGQLTYSGEFATGGTGAGTGGDPLASQGALVLRGNLLFAVNAGSNDVSMFRVAGDKLELVDRVASGGRFPVSLTVKGQLAYVLNAGGTPNITGFAIDPTSGRLVTLANSQRPLAGGTAAAPAEVHFGPDGETLIVSERGTQSLDIYKVDFRGYAVGPFSAPANAAVPFGFDVTRRGYAIVSEAGAGAASSYAIDDDGTLTPVGGPLLLGQRAPCWLVTTGDGRFAFTANAGSGSISSIAIGADGQLELLNGAAGSLIAPLDMALSANDGFLYARDGNGAVTGFRVNGDGSLSYVTTLGGIPAGAQGIAAR
jgi:6-phosphogluconolactonase (cycloisomerase 2 family)